MPNLAGNIVKGGTSGGWNIDPVLSLAGKLSAGSPARDAASNSESAQDIDGESRPAGAARDMGADEYVDSDSDGLADWWELKWFGNLATSGSADNDGDGLLNVYEMVFDTNPFLPDTDGNGIGDYIQSAYDTANPQYPTAWFVDADGDGLIFGLEVYYGSNPNVIDTNGDGIGDLTALRLGVSLTSLDVDGDGLSNAAEFALGTNVWYADTDGDGVNDGGDAFPFDPTRSAPLAPVPGDTVPPSIMLVEPTTATLLP